MNHILPTLVAVLNSLWQSALAAMLVWLALKFLPRTRVSINAATRHVIWWATLTVVLVLPVAPRLMEALHTRVQPAPAAAMYVQSRRVLETRDCGKIRDRDVSGGTLGQVAAVDSGAVGRG